MLRIVVKGLVVTTALITTLAIAIPAEAAATAKLLRSQYFDAYPQPGAHTCQSRTIDLEHDPQHYSSGSYHWYQNGALGSQSRTITLENDSYTWTTCVYADPTSGFYYQNSRLHEADFPTSDDATMSSYNTSDERIFDSGGYHNWGDVLDPNY